MPVVLELTVDTQQRVVASHAGAPLCDPVPLEHLDAITPASNPYRLAPEECGRRLFDAMGGRGLVRLLAESDDDTLHLQCDPAAAALPWEYACDPQNDFLAATYCVLRLLPDARAAAPAQPGPLVFLALAADPLVDEHDSAFTGQRLDIEHELEAIYAELHQAAGEGTAIIARRVPPTSERLRMALARGPAVLHLSCHGTLVSAPSQDGERQLALLALEDPNGRLAYLRGDRLTSLPPRRGLLRLVVISACQTALAGSSAHGGAGGRGDANLARALVYSGMPAAVGMQGNLPDRASDEFAAALYHYLLAGSNLGEALRQARLALRASPDAIGLPVAYIAPGGDSALPLVGGQSLLGSWQAGANVSVPLALQPPKPLYGREADLYALACTIRTGQEDPELESKAHNVVTVVGTGGIGKTALTAAWVQRFGWRFRGGVVGATLAALPGLNPRTLLIELLRRRTGRAESDFANYSAEQLAEALLEAARSPGSLVWIDNYESVLQCLPREARAVVPPGSSEEQAGAVPEDEAANAQLLHRLLAGLAAAGVPMLLTSREQPAGFAGEVIFPSPRQPLDGVESSAGAQLFFQHSPRAAAARQQHRWLAAEIARQTEGHPLAIMLLGGEFHSSPEVTATDFAANWAGGLAAARRDGLAGHHVTFEVALRRSLDRLTEERRRQLFLLSRFPAPFFAEGAALLWNGTLPADEAQMAAVQHELARYTQASLLKVDQWFRTDTPATYRFDPAVQRMLQQLGAHTYGQDETGYLRYAAWLVNRAFGEIGSDVGLAQLLQQWLDELERVAAQQEDAARVRYCWKLSVLLRQFGRIDQAIAVLALGEEAGEEHQLYSRLLQAKAELLVLRGELDEALRLYARCLQLNTGADDEGERGANLHAMATVYVTRGDLDRALQLYQESLAIKDKLGNIRGRSVTLHQMANVYVARGDLDQALRLYQESLAIDEKLGDIQGRSSTLSQMAYVYVTRGDLDQALQLYQESLAIKDKLGDIQGRSATLSQMSNVVALRGDWSAAERYVAEALQLAQSIGDAQRTAFTVTKLGQIAQLRGDLGTAKDRYEQGLEIFTRLGMPEARQVSALLRSLENEDQDSTQQVTPVEAILALTRAAGDAARGKIDSKSLLGEIEQALAAAAWSADQHEYLAALAGAVRSPGDAERDRLAAAAPALGASGDGETRFGFLLAAARLLDALERPAAAVDLQQQAAEILRSLPATRATQERLSVVLFNLANSLAAAGQLGEAVQALEAVVAVDEQWQLPDLASDRQALAAMRMRGDGTPGQGDAAQAEQGLALAEVLRAQIKQLPPEQRVQLEAAVAQFQQLSPAEQGALLSAQVRSQVEEDADSVVDAALHAAAANATAELLPKLEAAAAVYAEGETPDSPYAQLAQFTRGVAAYLAGSPPLPVPPSLVERYAGFIRRLAQQEGDTP